MTQVVEHQKDSDDRNWGGIEPERTERDQRAQWKPARPYEAVADTAKWSTQRSSKPLDECRCYSVELRSGERANSHAGEVRVRIEIARVPRECFGVELAAATARQ